MMVNVCSVDGCSSVARSGRALYCEKHYYRLRRTGSLDDPVFGSSFVNSNGYVVVYAPDHPLRAGKKSNAEYEHRIELYNHVGKGPLSCHVCGAQVTWDILHVDHLNDCKTDNRVENLKPSCATCNQSRGMHKMRNTQRRKSKYRLTHGGVTMCLAEWAGIVGISKVALRERLNRGWSVEDALTKPSGTYVMKAGRPKGRA